MFYNRFNRKNYRNVYESKTSERLCPYCGEDVVYYENSYGSRVFFEDFGKPWDKHGCREFLDTDKARVYICGAGETGIYWVKRGYSSWYRLEGLSADIESLRHKGVYIIWYFDVLGTARTVKVGSGQLGASLEAERRNPDVQRYADRGRLHVTWALVGSSHRGSVVDSLNRKLQPFVARREFGDSSICVELPTKLTWTY